MMVTHWRSMKISIIPNELLQKEQWGFISQSNVNSNLKSAGQSFNQNLSQAKPAPEKSPATQDGDTLDLSVEAINLQKSTTAAPNKEDPLVLPDDVANHVVQKLIEQYEQIGGSKLDFVKDVNHKLTAPTANERLAARGAQAYARNSNADIQTFRDQVKSLITSGLDAWANSREKTET